MVVSVNNSTRTHSRRLFDAVRLYTNKLFAENVQLYSQLGYQVDREEEFTGGIVVHMSKSVRPAGHGANVR
jgi:hypothetical protein